MKDKGVDLAVLARYMQMCSGGLCRRLYGKAIDMPDGQKTESWNMEPRMKARTHARERAR